MSGNDPDGVKPKQEDAIVALINHPTVRLAAEAVGVSEKTMYRWLGEPDFAREHRKARRLAFTQAITLTNKYAPMAVQTLAKIASDPTAPHSARVAASAALLKFSREAIELDDLAGRLDEVEARLSAKHVENTYGAHG